MSKRERRKRLSSEIEPVEREIGGGGVRGREKDEGFRLERPGEI